MVEGFVFKAPLLQAIVDIVLVGKHESSALYRLHDDRLDIHLLNIGKHGNGDIAIALDKPEYRRLLGRQRTATGAAP